MIRSHYVRETRGAATRVGLALWSIGVMLVTPRVVGCQEPPVWAPTESQWVRVDYGDPYPRGALVYVDTASVVRESQDVVRVWVLTGWSEASRVPAPVAHGQEGTFDNARTLVDFDCRGRRTRTLRMDGYLGRGEVFSTDGQAEWMTVLPQSQADALMPLVCDLAAGGVDPR